MVRRARNLLLVSFLLVAGCASPQDDQNANGSMGDAAAQDPVVSDAPPGDAARPAQAPLFLNGTLVAGSPCSIPPGEPAFSDVAEGFHAVPQEAWNRTFADGGSGVSNGVHCVAWFDDADRLLLDASSGIVPLGATLAVVRGETSIANAYHIRID